jgi:hypothetical protein
MNCKHVWNTSTSRFSALMVCARCQARVEVEPVLEVHVLHCGRVRLDPAALRALCDSAVRDVQRRIGIRGTSRRKKLAASR